MKIEYKNKNYNGTVTTKLLFLKHLFYYLKITEIRNQNELIQR